MKKYEKKYAFNLEEHKKMEIKKNQLSSIIERGKRFYDAIERKHIFIKSTTKKLNLIKDNSLKEFIYSNIKIPLKWKQKLNYDENLDKLIKIDKNFCNYIKTRNNNKKNTIINLNLNKQSLKYSKSNKSLINKSNSYNTLTTAVSIAQSKSNQINNNNNKEEEIKIILNNFNKEECKSNYYPTGLRKLNNNNNNKKDNSVNLSLKLPLFSKINYNKNYCLQKSIYNNLLPKSVDRNKSEFSMDLTNKDSFNKNSFILDELHKINNYGPYSSFCQECKIKNIGFYNNMEFHQCEQLIKHIYEYKQKQKYKNENINNSFKSLDY